MDDDALSSAFRAMAADDSDSDDLLISDVEENAVIGLEAMAKKKEKTTSLRPKLPARQYLVLLFY